MKIELHIDGKEYVSPETDEATAEETADMFYENLADLNKFRMTLADGGFLLLGPEAAKRAVLIFRV